MQLSIIIVSYNTRRLLRQCLASVFQHPPQHAFEVIVVDNHSTDDTSAMVSHDFPQVKLLVNPDNLGFAAANNLGAKQAAGEYLLLLNSDTIINSPVIPQLLRLAQQHQAPIATCQLTHTDGSIQPQGGCLPNLFTLACWMLFIDDLPLLNRLLPKYQQSDPDHFRQDRLMGWVSGTALLIHKSVYQTLGGLDDQIFMYGEDVEFCYRAHLKHLPVHYFHQPQIIHLAHRSGSSGQARVGEYQGLIYLYQKHKPAWQMPILRLLLQIGACLRWFIFGIIKGDAAKRQAYYQAFNLARS